MTKHQFSRQFSRWLKTKLRDGRMWKSETGAKRPTSKTLAVHLGVDPSAVTNWLRGCYPQSHNTVANEPCTPNREHAKSIAAFLGEPRDLVLLLAGHAPEMDPERAYRLLRPSSMEERKAVAL